MENKVRLRRNNETALKLVIVLAGMRLLLTALAGGYVTSKLWMMLQIGLCAAVIIGCIVMYQLMTDSDITKFVACGSFILVAGISIFNSDNLYNIFPYCALIVVTLVYLSDVFSVLCAALCSVVLLIKTILVFTAHGFELGGTWLFALVLFAVMSYALYAAAMSVVRAQETDRQEIQYHLMYQEEVTQNMVDVVEKGTEHIALLQSKLDSFQEATDVVAQSVDAISQGVGETVSNIESQTDMTSQIQQIIDNLLEVKDHTILSTNEAVSATDNGAVLVKQLKEKSDDIAVANQSVTEVAQELREKISSAEEITQIIYQVSSQTNLLALNASIEAARAGEAGRGFSVVADEIRNLADNTKQSVDKITELLQGVTKLAEQTSQLVVNSVQASEAQAQYIDEVTQSFHSISGVVDELHDNMTHLDSLSNSLNTSNNVIIESLSHQQAASEEMAANAQSSADLSQSNLQDLTDVIGELDQIAEIIGSLKATEGVANVVAAAPVPSEEKDEVEE